MIAWFVHFQKSRVVQISFALLDIMVVYASRLEASYLTHHLTLLTPQQSVRQWRSFVNDNEANAHKS